MRKKITILIILAIIIIFAYVCFKIYSDWRYNFAGKRGIGEGIELVKGNILETIPNYLEKRPSLKISLLNLDTDVYEPAVITLEKLYPRVCKGGVIIIDNYAKVPGETKAVDEYFKDLDVEINKFPFSSTPCYFIKK